MEVLKVAGITLVGIFAITVIKGYKKDFAFYVSLAANILIFSCALYTLLPFFNYINELAFGEIYSEYFKIMFKAVAIAVLTSVVSGICNDADEYSLAQKFEMYGKATILVLSIPILKNIFDIVSDFTKNG